MTTITERTAKKFVCGDIMKGCDFAVQSSNEDEILDVAALHVKKSHGMEQLEPHLANKVKAAIKDVQR